MLGPAFDLRAERSIVLPVAGVDDLAEVVERAVRGRRDGERASSVRRPPDARATGKKARPDRSVGRLFEASFEVDEIALVASTLTDRGSVYETVDNLADPLTSLG